MKHTLLVRDFLAAGQRAGWTLADQSLSSLTNLPLNLLAAHLLSPRDFGALNLVFTTFLVALGISRALASEPLMVRFSGMPDDHFRGSAVSAAGLTVVLGTALGFLTVIIAIFLAPPLRDGLFAVALVLPGLLYLDCWRYVSFAHDKGSSAFMADLAWAMLLFPLLALLAIGDQLSLVSLVLIWGGAASAAGTIGLRNAQLRPRLRLAIPWLKSQWDLSSRYTLEFLLCGGISQMMWYAVAAVTGLASLGSLRAASVLLGPLYMLSQGLTLVFVPRQVRTIRQQDGNLLHNTIWISIVQITIAIGWGLAASSLPSSIGRLLLGQSWGGADHVVLLLAFAVAGRLATSGPAIGLRALAAAGRGLRAGVLTSALILTGGVGGALLGGAQGVVTGLLCASWLSCPFYWWHFLNALKERIDLDTSDKQASHEEPSLT